MPTVPRGSRGQTEGAAALTRAVRPRRVFWWALASLCGALATLLALGHPISPLFALLGCAVFGAAGWRFSLTAPIWVVALLPLAGLTPWSGWFVLDEFDLLVLSVICGAAARQASQLVLPKATAGALPPWPCMGLLLCGALQVLGVMRGVADAGGWKALSWWQGYHEPLNALRLGRGFALAMLWLPLWQRARAVAPAAATRHLVRSLAALVALTALLTLWERLAFTGLLNFSSDYRATALFWEMHVGGAALDAVLVVGLPFMLSAVATSRHRLGWAAAVGAALLVVYAAAVTFSRVVYVGAPLGFIVWWAVRARLDKPPDVASSASKRGDATWLGPLLLLCLGTGATLVLFPVAGYRGLIALVACLGILMPLAWRSQSVTWPLALAVTGGGGLAWALAHALVLHLPKVNYVLLGAACAAAATVLCRQARGSGPVAADARARPQVAALWFAYQGVAVGVGGVAIQWGGANALQAGLCVAAVLMVLPLALLAWRGQTHRSPPWPSAARWQLSFLAFMTTAGLACGVVSGGAYMGDRWATLERDLHDRGAHWRQAFSLLTDHMDWTFGRGLGRYASANQLQGRVEERTGDYRLLEDQNGRHVVLTGGNHVMGWGEMFRLSQHTSAPGAEAVLRLRARAQADVALHFELCEKHLLYNLRCLTGKRGLRADGRAWQALEVPLRGEEPGRGSWYAPRLIAFSAAVESSGGRVELDDLDLRAADGHPLLSNGDFESGLAHWYTTSDHLHMPWHAKNLVVHLLFEQGVLGLGLFAVLLGVAGWRLSVWDLRRDALAPPMLAALLGLLVVGSGDSLLDMPRVAFLVYLLIGVALVTRRTQAQA